MGLCAPTVPDLSGDELEVWNELCSHVGRRQALPLPLLAAAVDLHPRVVQRVVKHLIEHHALPIGSATGSRYGYYLIDDAEDATQAKAQLRHRILSCARRLARLEDTTTDLVLGQLRLGLEEGMRES